MVISWRKGSIHVILSAVIVRLFANNCHFDGK